VARKPAMPPPSAVPLLRTLRRVTVVMHSSLVMCFGRSDAGLECLSVYRGCVVQRMRAFSRAQHVVSTIICWCSHSSVGGDFGARQGEFFAEQRRDDIVPNRYGDAIGGLYRVGALQPAHEPYPPTQQWYCRRRASFPRLMESLVPECLREVIVAGRSRKSSATFGTPGISECLLLGRSGHTVSGDVS